MPPSSQVAFLPGFETFSLGEGEWEEVVLIVDDHEIGFNALRL